MATEAELPDLDTRLATVGKSGSYTRHSPAFYEALDELLARLLTRRKPLVHHRDSSFCVFVKVVEQLL